MKDRPINFLAEMVRAILEGRKTQTRRVFKYAPSGLRAGHYPAGPEHEGLPPSRYGYPGDRLWVRETWAPNGDSGAVWFRAGIPEYRSGIRTGNWLNWPYKVWSSGDPPETIMWRPSIHMPRWASRIALEITGVRVERVQDISEEDAKAEGIRGFTDNLGSRHSNPTMIYPAFPEKDGGFLKARDAFEALWNSINAKRGYGWDTNPWVWILEFKVAEWPYKTPSPSS